RGAAVRVVADDGDGAVTVDTEDLAAGRAAVPERDGHLVAAEVMGVRQDAAVGDNHAAAAGPLADPDQGRAGRGGDAADRVRELVEDGHARWPPEDRWVPEWQPLVGTVVSCKSQHTNDFAGLQGASGTTAGVS